MKKVLTITLLVLLTVGLFIACNADAVGSAFNNVPKGFVDLGIKDKKGKTIYWAECNLGATKPEEAGYYYFWAGTTGYKRNTSDTNWVNAKTEAELNGGFDKVNAPYYESSKYTKYNTSDKKTVLDSGNDAATAVNPSWRTPTRDEFIELVKNCVWVWTDNYNGVKGFIVYKAKNDGDKAKVCIGSNTWKHYDELNSDGITFTTTDTDLPSSVYDPNDTHIFLPVTGYGGDNDLKDESNFDYWSSSRKADDGYYAYAYVLQWNSSEEKLKLPYFNRELGFAIRPIIVK